MTLQLQLRRYTTLQIQPQLHYTTLHPVVMRDRCNHCNHSKNTTPTTFRPISGFALPSVIHNYQPYRFPIFETSATALCGTGIQPRSIAKHWDLPIDHDSGDAHLVERMDHRPNFADLIFFTQDHSDFLGCVALQNLGKKIDETGTGNQKPAQGLIFGDGYNTSLDQVTWNMVIPRWLGNHWLLRAGKNIERSKWGIYSMAATLEYRRTTMFWY